MALLKPRQSFLPSSISECFETKATWNGKELPSKNGGDFGFDDSGKYLTAFVNLYNASSIEMMDGLYSSFDENDADDFNRFSLLIYSVNEETNKLQAAGMIQLEEIEENPYIKHEYNLEFHRWFIIEDSDFYERNVIIRSGSLKPLINLIISKDKRTIVTTFQETEDTFLELTYPGLQKQLTSSSVIETKEHGSLLLLYVAQSTNHEEVQRCNYFAIDLIKFDEKECSHFKRISATKLLDEFSTISIDSSVCGLPTLLV